MSVRYVSIDILRTAAIVLMVLVHFMENLAGAVWTPAGFGAPVFTFLVGVSYRLWVNSQVAKGVDESGITRVSVRRGLFLIAVGFAFNVAVWLPADTFNWDVLTLIGSALLVLTAVRNAPPAVPLVLAVAAFLLGPLLRALTDYHSYWPDGYFDPDLTASDVLVGYLSTGYFPLFPWLALPLFGFGVGTAFFSREPGREPPTGRAALLGAALLGLAVVLVGARKLVPELSAVRFLGGWTMFPPSTEYVTGSVGLALLMFALTHRWIDPRAESLAGTRVVRVAGTFSKYSLSVYVFHHVAHLWPLWVYGAISGQEATAYWRRALPVWATVPLAGCCLVAAYALFRWMDRTGRGGIEGWMRRVCG